MPTDVELYLSPALPPRGFDEVPPDLVDPAGDFGSPTWGMQVWRPFRFRLVEAISELPRLELWMTRREGFRPASRDDGISIFDRLRQRTTAIRNANNAFDNALNQLGNNWDARNYTALPGDIGNTATTGAALVNQAVAGVTGTAADAANTFGSWQNVQEDVLGLGVPGEPWPGNPPPSPLEMLGTTRSVRFARQDAATNTLLHGRWFTGVVSEFEDYGNLMNARRAISIVIVPSLFRLSLRKDCRIFQDMDAEAIVRDVLARAGLYNAGSLEIRLPAPLAKREYCVQWNETDLAFVQRLLEEEGLVFWFEHRKGAEKLIIADGSLVGDVRFNALDPLATLSGRLPHRLSPNPQDARNEEQVWSFGLSKRIRSDKVSVRDFNFSDPRNYVRNTTSEDPALYEIAEYELRPAVVPPEDPEYAYKLVDPARKTAQHRLDAIVSGETTARGESNAVAMSAGLYVDVFENRDTQIAATQQLPQVAAALQPEGSFLVTRVEHFGLTDPAAVGPGETPGSVPFSAGYMPPGGLEYANRFTAIPAVPGAARFRVLPTVPRPRIPGVQTAIVLGPDATDPIEASDRRDVDWIHLDALGRVQVRFPWDRRADDGQPDAYLRGRSAWLRVATPWAGDGYGVSFVPRANMEVVVGFENGDPDRPLVLGAVHNRRNPYPVERKHIDHAKPNVLGEKPSKDDERVYYKLDTPHVAKPTLDLNLIRTRSHKGTSSKEFRADGYNEISFHDASGSERIRVHAERDLVEDVEHDHTTVVVNDQLNIVGNDHDEKIGKVAALAPSDGSGDGGASEEGGKQTLVVAGTRRKIVAGHEKTTVVKDRTVDVRGTETLTVRRDRTETVAGQENVQIGSSPASAATRELVVNGFRHTKVSGNDKLDVTIDQTVTVGGAFSMAGSTVSMVVTTPPGAPPGPSMTVDAEGNQTVEAKGDPGTIHLTAHGGDPEQPETTTGTLELLAQKTLTMKSSAPTPPGGVRFECGDEVWLEIGPEGISMKAPKRVLLKCGASELQVEHAGDHERVVFSTRTNQDQPEAFWMSLKGGGAGDAPVVYDDAAAKNIEDSDQQADAAAEDGIVTTARTIRGDDVGYVEPGTELPEIGQEDTWQMPGIILTATDIEIDAGAVIVTSQKGVNIQEKEAGEWVTTRLLSKSERDVLEALEGAERDLESMIAEQEMLKEPLAEKEAKYKEQADATEEKRKAAFDTGGTDEKWRKTCRDLQNAEAARKAAEVRYEETKADLEEAQEDGVVEDEDWKFDEAKNELEKAKKREEDAKKAERAAYEDHKKAREELGAEEQKLADVKKDYDETKREYDELEKRIKVQRQMVAMFQDEAAKRTAPRTNG